MASSAEKLCSTRSPVVQERVVSEQMAPSKHPAFLRLIHSSRGPEVSTPPLTAAGKAQESFLPSSRPGTLIFLVWGKASTDEMLDIFELSKPKVIFDLRIVPRFDLSLNRRQFFNLLKQYGCHYVDVLGRMGVSNLGDALLNPVLIAKEVTKFAEGLPFASSGPFVFLHDDKVIDDQYVSYFAKALVPAPGVDWQVYRPQIPGDQVAGRAAESENSQSQDPNDPTSLIRRAVFVSHATPEDNAFVTWLCSKLTAAGYEVWSDVTNLKGGDVFWQHIEEMIRLRAAKVIFVHSAHVKGKAGVRKEVYLALKVGDRNRLQRFVIPVRIDNTPFDDTLIELIDIQAIDCRHDWLAGLNSLIAVLQRDGVPRDAGFKSEQFAQLISLFNQPVSRIARSPETLTSNWLSVVTPPQQITFFACQGIKTSELPSIAARLSVPAYAYFTHIATTSNYDSFGRALSAMGLGEIGVRQRAAISWEDFVAARSGDLPSWKPKDARINASALLSKAWNLFLESRGAISAPLSNGRQFWFFADKHFQNNEIRFSHFSGRTVRRQLTGYSAKRRVFWHFGTQARPVLDHGSFQLILTPHVTFSGDGRSPLESKAQLHSLRRSFCRSWWNDRWRDLLQAYVVALADGSEVLRLDVGSSVPVQTTTRFRQYLSPVSLSDVDALAEEETLSLDYDEGDDSDEDYEGLLDFAGEVESPAMPPALETESNLPDE
jgi:hypothetical protein